MTEIIANEHILGVCVCVYLANYGFHSSFLAVWLFVRVLFAVLYSHFYRCYSQLFLSGIHTRAQTFVQNMPFCHSPN